VADLELRVFQLDARLTKAEAGVTVTKKRPRNAVTPVTEKPDPVTAAERMRAYRTRKRKNPG
jgi:hypothetical protein